MHKLSDCLYNVFQTNILHGKNLDLEESADKMFLKLFKKDGNALLKIGLRTAVMVLFDMQVIRKWMGRSYFVQYIFWKNLFENGLVLNQTNMLNHI